MDTRCDTVSGELHATFVESSPGGSHALPLVAPPVAQPVAAPVAQPVTCQRPGTVKTISTNDLSKPTVTDQGTTHRLAMKQPPPTPTFPHQHTKKSPHNQHVLSFNPGLEATRRATLAARATTGREDPAPRRGAPRRKRGPRTIGARPPPSSSTTIRWEVGLGQAPPW